MSKLYIKQRCGPLRVGAKKKKNDIIVAVSMVLIAA